MAKLTLQEQLLKSGLATTAQAKKIKSDKNKQLKQQQKNNVSVVDEIKTLAQQAQELKSAKDRELNQLRKQEADQKALLSQIKQLIEPNLIAQEVEGVAYHFNDTGKIKTLYVSEKVREQLSVGTLAIVRLEKHYGVVPLGVAQKIRERDADYFIVLNEIAVQTVIDEAYAAYVIPDDLIW